MQELASLVLAADTSQMVKAIEVMDKASQSAEKLSEANMRLARAGAEASGNRTTRIVDDERKIEEALGKEILAIQRHTVAYERMQAQASRTATSGIRSPQAVSEELAGLSRARDMWEEAGKSAKGYDGALAQIVARESTLIEGNSRHRGALRQTAAAMASLAFEAGGAAFLITAVAGALAAPIMPGVGLSKAIEDTRLGMASILISMGRINGVAPTLPQALQISGSMMDKLVNASMRFGVSIEALANTLRSTLAPGLAAGMSLEQIQKVATIGTIAVKTIGLDSRQTVQEIRDLVAGGIQASSSTLATSLGIKDSDIKRWREAGTLYDELMNKMQGFQIAAVENANTLSGSWDILQTKVALLMSSETGFNAIKEVIKSISAYIGTFNEQTGRMEFNPDLLAQAKAFWDVLIGIKDVLVEIGKLLSLGSPTLVMALQTVAVVLSEITFTFSTVAKEIAVIATQAVAIAHLDFSGAAAIGKQWKEDAQAARIEHDKSIAGILGLADKTPKVAMAQSPLAAEITTVPRATDAWAKAYENQVQKKADAIAKLDALYVAETTRFAGSQEHQMQLAKDYAEKRAQIDLQFAAKRPKATEADKELAHYDALMLKAKEYSAQLDAQATSADKLTKSQKDLAAFDVAVREGKSGINAKQQAEYRYQLEANVTKELVGINEKENTAAIDRLAKHKRERERVYADEVAAELKKITDNFKGVFEGLLDPGVNVFKKIADSFGAALNKSIKDALTKALFEDMGKAQNEAMAKTIDQVATKIKEAKKALEGWATETFGGLGGAAKGSPEAARMGQGISDAIVLAGTQLFKSFSSQASQAQLNAVNQGYIQQWQGTGTVLGDMSAKSTSIVSALDTLNKTTFGSTDYLAQMTTSMKNVDKGMTSLLTELGKVLGVTGISQTAIGGKTTEKAISDGMATIGNIVGNIFGVGNVGSLLQGLFGSSSTTITGTGVNFQGTAAQMQKGQGGQQYTSGVTESSSFWGLVSSSSTWTTYSALASSVTKTLGDIFKNIGDTIKGAAVALGGNLGTLTKQVESFVIATGNISLAGMSVQQQQEALSNIISKQSDLMVAAIVPSMKAFQVAGEGLLQTLVRVVSEFATLTTFYKVLGDTSLVTAASADKLVTALGGVDAANQSMTKFVSNFASESVKSSLALNALEVALTNAGLKGIAPMIKTTQDYFSLMQVASNEQRVVLLQQQDTALAYIKSISSAFTFMLDQASKFANIAKTEMGFVMNNLSSLASSMKGAAQQMYQAFMQQTSPDYQMQQYRKSLAQITDAYAQYKATGVAPNAASLQQAVGVVSSTSNISMYATAEDWKRGTLQTIDVLSGMGNLADAQLTILTQISGTMDKLLTASQEQIAATNAGNYAAAADAEKRAAQLSVNLKWLEGVNSLLTNSAAQNTLVIDLVSQTVSATTSGNSALIDTLQRYISSGGKTMIGSGATTGLGGAFSSAGGLLPSGTAAGALNQVAGMQALAGFGASGIATTSIAANQLPTALSAIQTANAASAAAAADAAKRAETAASAERAQAKTAALQTLNAAVSSLEGIPALVSRWIPRERFNELVSVANPDYVNATSAVTAARAAYESLPAFAQGTNFLPSDMIAQVHEGERIIPKADNLQLMQRLQDPQANNEALAIEIRALREEVRQLRESNTAENIASINATQKTAKIIDRWDGDGMPDIRTIGAAV